MDGAVRVRPPGTPGRPPAAGPDHQLVLVDRVLVTLNYLRLQLSCAALAELYGVTRPIVTCAIHGIRPLLTRCGFAVPQLPGVRLRTLADVFAYAEAEGVDLRADGTEVQVRRPRPVERAARRSCPARRML
ncbi:transposase family protein [Streptomyces sp. NPDC001276]|uniref:transposase family protein n=1 Tax=Streptomyces sp. NPDC001276 TaxID=3364555 RepID=UPI0036C4F656